MERKVITQEIDKIFGDMFFQISQFSKNDEVNKLGQVFSVGYKHCLLAVEDENNDKDEHKNDKRNKLANLLVAVKTMGNAIETLRVENIGNSGKEIKEKLSNSWGNLLYSLIKKLPIIKSELSGIVDELQKGVMIKSIYKKHENKVKKQNFSDINKSKKSSVFNNIFQEQDEKIELGKEDVKKEDIKNELSEANIEQIKKQVKDLLFYKINFMAGNELKNFDITNDFKTLIMLSNPVVKKEDKKIEPGKEDVKKEDIKNELSEADIEEAKAQAKNLFLKDKMKSFDEVEIRISVYDKFMYNLDKLSESGIDISKLINSDNSLNSLKAVLEAFINKIESKREAK